MPARLDYLRQAPQAFKKYLDFNMHAKDRSIEQSLGDLVAIRASQLNGCAFCVDMHAKEATIHGERPLRLYHLPIWRESTLFTPRERAALAWTEVLTRIPEHGVPDELYEDVRTQLTEAELTDLTWLVVAINGWNRMGVAFRAEPGSKDAEYGLDKANLA
jgi:AhpD family alkylhydroperoxidase